MATLDENILCKRKELTKQGDITYFIYNLFKESGKNEVIVINIGTDRAKFDCFAPFIGTMLKERKSSLTVYGDLENPIHALNLKDKIEYINSKHKNAFIVALDSAVSEENNTIGSIFARNKPVEPRKALNSDLGSVGDASIVYRVDAQNIQMFNFDKNIKLGDVFNAVSKVSKELLLLEKLINLDKNNNIVKFA